MLFDRFSSRIRFSPGCLTICERPISQIVWSTWESETDDACLDALFDSLPNPCSQFSLILKPTLAPFCSFSTDHLRQGLQLMLKGNPNVSLMQQEDFYMPSSHRPI